MTRVRAPSEGASFWRAYRPCTGFLLTLSKLPFHLFHSVCGHASQEADRKQANAEGQSCCLWEAHGLVLLEGRDAAEKWSVGNKTGKSGEGSEPEDVHPWNVHVQMSKEERKTRFVKLLSAFF